MVALSETAEGSSSSSLSSVGLHTYDVFISFRGCDTRRTFTDHLHKALMDADIATFVDDENIKTEEDLKLEMDSASKTGKDRKLKLESVIKQSRASIIVLSENYANSSRCLDELVLILEQRRKFNQIVIPVFYNVESTNIMGLAMEEHKLRTETETNTNKRSELGQQIEQWKEALAEVAEIKGKDVAGRRETELIEEIVRYIFRRLRVSSRSLLPQLIGMENSKNFVTSWLKDESSDTAEILTISGMGGIGKTSLVKYVYGLHSHEFHTSSFLEDISRICDKNFNPSRFICETFNGLLSLQKQLHDDISEPSSIQVDAASIYTSLIESALASKKVFLVLDDIDSLDQLDFLLGRKGIHPGSKIIVTTKEARLIERCALFQNNVKPKHVQLLLKGLDEADSRKLFCFHGFSCNNPKEGYEEVSKKLVKYCEGLPLALEVLGKTLHDRDVDYWEECIAGLKKEIDPRINSVLRRSFDSLPSENDRELFKHIACFFVGMDKDIVETILDACSINTCDAFTNVIDRGLLGIGQDNKLMMHKLFQEMGRFIVREESPDKPWEQSRVWCHEESLKMLLRKKGTKHVLGLTLDMGMLEDGKLPERFKMETLKLETDAFSKMDKLMLLQLSGVEMDGSYENFPKEIRWLCMHRSPFELIPSNLPTNKIVALDLSYSSIESFDVDYLNLKHLNLEQRHKKQKVIDSCSKNTKSFGSLKILNLSFCDQLSIVGGFEELPALERLIVRNCDRLVEVHESIGKCVELVVIDLSYCKNLKKLPETICKLKKVNLLIDGCDLDESQNEINDGMNTKTSSPAILDIIQNHLEFALSLPGSLVMLSFVNNSFSFEIRGMVKIQPMAVVKDVVFNSLGWIKSDLLDERCMGNFSLHKAIEESQIQMYYEFGIFSTIYAGIEMPSWITDRKEGPSISFTIPLSPNNLTGLNFCFVQSFVSLEESVELPVIIIKNITKNHTWIYDHCIDRVSVGGECVILLSHWMFGKSEMEGGDQVTITVITSSGFTKECGVSFVYDDGKTDEEEEDMLGFVYDDGKSDEDEDVLGYYKSWNHIIGGDLTGFQLTTGEYILHNERFMPTANAADITQQFLGCGIAEATSFKEPEVCFRALSQRKSDILN